MTCCVEPLIALAGGASIISVVMGVVGRDPIMVLGGIAAFFSIVVGFLLYSKYKTKLIEVDK